MRDLNKKIMETYKKSRYLRERSMKCESSEQTARVRKEQDEYYKKWEFLVKLRNEMEKE